MNLPEDTKYEIAQQADTATLIGYCTQDKALRDICEKKIWYQRAIALPGFDFAAMPVNPPYLLGQKKRSLVNYKKTQNEFRFNPNKPTIGSNQAYYFLAAALFNYDPVASTMLVQPFYIAWRGVVLGDYELFKAHVGFVGDFYIWFFVYRRWDWPEMQQITRISDGHVEAFYSFPISPEDMANFQKFISTRSIFTARVKHYYSQDIANNIKKYPTYIDLNLRYATPAVYIAQKLAEANFDDAIESSRKLKIVNLDIFDIYAIRLPVDFIAALIDEKLLKITSLFKYMDRYNLWHWFNNPSVKTVFIEQGSKYEWTSQIAKKLLTL